MKPMMLAFAAATVTLAGSIPAHVAAAEAASPAARVAAPGDACPLAALPVVGPLLCGAIAK